MNKKYTTEECLQEYYDSLEKQLADKDTMIDWLCAKLQSYCDNPAVHNCDICRKGECHNHNWRDAAHEAVKKND